MFKRFFKNIGPGPLIAAAFIGPGTVTVCTLAGVQDGFSLLWAMLLSIFATIVLQEMSARVGLVTQKGLSEVVRSQISNVFWRGAAILLLISAIVIGNAAYEAGNVSGGVLGLESVFGNPNFNFIGLQVNVFSLIIGIIAFLLLFFGNYKTLEKALVTLMVFMSLSFLITAIMTRPNLIEIFKGMFVPNLSEDNVLTVIALVGTTVVPYNLFLHASLVNEKWRNVSDLKFAKRDTIIAITIGGLVSMCIIISAAAIRSSSISSAADLARSLEPLFGASAKYILSLGLFAAGITSAITAPLAAAYVAAGCLGWSTGMTSGGFRAVWIFVLFLGVLFSSIGFRSVEIIKFAQVANGVLLPVIAAFLLWVMNKAPLLGNYRNSKFQNVLGGFVLVIVLFLGVKSILKVFSLL
ncbi:MAG: Nramp family divalent metal transporter [Bacteroidota bacterium]